MKKNIIIVILFLLCMCSNVKAKTYNNLRVLINIPEVSWNVSSSFFTVYNYDTLEPIDSFEVTTQDFENGYVIKLDDNYKKIILKDIMHDKHFYQNNSTYIVEFKNNVARVTINYEVQYTKVVFSSQYSDYIDRHLLGVAPSDITIFDNNHNKIMDLDGNTTILYPGYYYFEDNYANQGVNADIHGSIYNVSFDICLLKEFYVNKEIKSICKDNYCYEFEQVDNRLFLNEYLYPDIYLFTTYDGEYLIDLLDDYRLHIELNDDELSINEPDDDLDKLNDDEFIIEPDEEYDEFKDIEEIIVNVPDTGL